MLCSRMSYLVLWNTCCKLSRSQILEVSVYKTFNLFAIAQVTFSVVCIMLSTFFPFVSFFEPFPSLLLLLITVISIPIFSSCNRLPNSLLPNIIHFFIGLLQNATESMHILVYWMGFESFCNIPTSSLQDNHIFITPSFILIMFQSGYLNYVVN